jgi:hypothetical protein
MLTDKMSARLVESVRARRMFTKPTTAVLPLTVWPCGCRNLRVARPVAGAATWYRQSCMKHHTEAMLVLRRQATWTRKVRRLLLLNGRLYRQFRKALTKCQM